MGKTNVIFVNELFFLGLCISDPQMCDEGMAMAVKLKFNDEAKNYTDEPRFILDSGAHDSQSRGFSLYIQDGKLHCVVAISNGEWKVSVNIEGPGLSMVGYIRS